MAQQDASAAAAPEPARVDSTAAGAAQPYYANARRQLLASHSALVGLLARKHVEERHPRNLHWGVGALLTGFLHDLGKIDPLFQGQLAMAEPPDRVGVYVNELSWALTHLAFDPSKVRRLLPGMLPWHVVQYAVFWRDSAIPTHAWDQKRFANLEQMCRKAGDWTTNCQPAVAALLADIEAKTRLPVFPVEPRARLVGQMQTPEFRKAPERREPSGQSYLASAPSQEAMDAAIRDGVTFANRMVSGMGPNDVEDVLQAWCKSKYLPALEIAREVDDYTTIPADCLFTLPLST